MWKSFWKNLSISCDLFLVNIDTGSISARRIAAGMIVPAIEKIRVLVLDSPSFMPRGIANFRFRMGVIAAKKTVSSCGISLCLVCLFYLFIGLKVKE